MKTIKNYLKMLNEAKSYKDGSMPNPYDYQSLELDEKVTRADLKELDKFRKKMKKFEDPKLADLTTKEWLYHEPPLMVGDPPGKRRKGFQVFVILDDNKRVGIVAFTSHSYEYEDIIWSSWVPGFNYAVRGTMKMIEQILNENDRKYKISRVIFTHIWYKNIPSIRVAEKLKMRLVNPPAQKGVSELYDLRQPFWWIKK